MPRASAIIRALYLPGTFLALLWVIWILIWSSGATPGTWGILPRHWQNWYGILTSPLVHGSWGHLLSNSFPLLLLGWLLFLSYPKQAPIVWTGVYLITGILVWLFARHSYHIGASGIVYGLAGFLFFGGMFRSDQGAIGISLLVAFLYGSLVWGVLPHQPGVSWESHLFGGITGAVLAAVLVRNKAEENPETPSAGKTFRDFLLEKDHQPGQ